MRKKSPYSELFWSAFSRMRLNTERYSVSPYSVRIRAYADQNNFEYEHFLRSVCFNGFSGKALNLKLSYATGVKT